MDVADEDFLFFLEAKERQCNETHYIPHFLNFNSPNQVIDAKTRIESTIQELEELLEQQQKAKYDLEQSKIKCTEAIKEVRKEINEAFDKLEEATFAELERKFKHISNELQLKMNNVQQSLISLKQTLDEIQASDDNECQQFVCASKSHGAVVDAKKMCSIEQLHLQLHEGSFFKFVRNSDITSAIESLYTLGDLTLQTTSPEYQIKRIDAFNMHVTDDDKPCEIISMSALESGDVLLADYMNCRLKLLETTTYRIRDYLALESERPVSVCKSRGLEAAVCLDSRKVRFVQVSPRGKIILGRVLKMDHVCRGIAIMGDQMYITNDGKRVYNYTMDGKLLRTFFKDRFDDDLFSHNREIAASDDATMIHITDKEEGLITLDKMGNLLWTFSNLTLHTARGVATDGSGNVFIVDYFSNNVLLVTPNGRYLQCNETHYIPHFLNFNSPNQVIDAKTRIESTIQELEELLEQQQKAKYDLEQSKIKCTEAIKEVRKEINEAFDKLEEATFAELERKFKHISNELQLKMNNVQQSLISLKQTLDEIQASDDNECQQFVCASKSHGAVVDAKKMCSIEQLHLQLHEGSFFKFVRNSDITSAIESLYTLGDLTLQTTSPEYQIKRIDAFNMHVTDDDKPCEIISMSALESGDVLLADYMNCRLKLLETTTYRIRDYLALESERPVSVCKSRGLEAAVCLDSRKVRFVQVSPRGKIILGRVLKMDHVCRGIAIMGDQMYITNDGKRVYNYTMDGKLLRTFFKDRFDDDLFSHNREIAASDDATMIHITDKEEGLITLDKMGNLLWTFSNLTLHTARGVATDGSGNVFIVDYFSNNVLLVTPNGRYLCEVVPAFKGIKNPLAVYFDKKNCKLLVAANCTNKLQVISLQCRIHDKGGH
ncbi:hypothetical protein ACF0H5_008308 [Mactra antiquata]